MKWVLVFLISLFSSVFLHANSDYRSPTPYEVIPEVSIIGQQQMQIALINAEQVGFYNAMVTIPCVSSSVWSFWKPFIPHVYIDDEVFNYGYFQYFIHYDTSQCPVWEDIEDEKDNSHSNPSQLNKGR